MNEIERLEFDIELSEWSIQVSMDNIEAAKKELKELKEKEHAENWSNNKYSA